MADTEHGPNSAEASQLPAGDAQLRALDSITSSLLMRAAFLRQAGVTFDGARDLYVVLGYDRLITTDAYVERYLRGGVAGRVVDVMPDATWRGGMELIEDEDPEKTTPFEQAWLDLDVKHGLQSRLMRLDKLSRLGTYAGLVIGAPGALSEELPIGGKLLYFRQYLGAGGPDVQRQSNRTVGSDGDITIDELELDPVNERFGLPKFYRITRIGLTTVNLAPVHWTRVIHAAEGCLFDDVYGIPALERVWNLFDDLEKVTGGGSEAFWLRANQGFVANLDKDMALSSADGALDKLKEDLEKYQHNLTRWIRTRGVDVKTLGSDVANFGQSADAILKQIAGAKGIPTRILTGSEMGELASSQDRDNFKDLVNGRQEQYAGPTLVRQLVDRLVQHKMLPTPAKGPLAYEVKWAHIQALTEAEKSEGAQKWAATNQTNGEVVFTDAEIRDKWYGMAPLTDEQRQEMAERAAEKLAQQQEAMAATSQPDENGARLERVRPRAAEDRELIKVLAAAIEAGNQDVVNKIIGLSDGPHKFSTTQVDLPDDVARAILAFGYSIPDEDIYEPEGRERAPHVTVKYGLPVDAEAPDVAGFGSVRIAFGKIDAFVGALDYHPEYDVLFLSVVSPDLVCLNAELSKLPGLVDTQPSYRPHATIAYLKPGLASKYVGREVSGLVTMLTGQDAIEVRELTFVRADGERTEIDLVNGTQIFKGLGDLPGHPFHGNQWTEGGEPERDAYKGQPHGVVVAKSKLGHVEVVRGHSAPGAFDRQGDARYMAVRKNGETVGTKSTLREAKELLRAPREEERQHYVSGHLRPDVAWKYKKLEAPDA